jgi:hypothetical protein
MREAVFTFIKLLAQGLLALVVTVLVLFCAALYGAHAFVAYAVSLFAGAIAFFLLGAILQENNNVVRGERLYPVWVVTLYSWWKTWRDPYPFYWAGFYFPFEAGTRSMCAVGAPGTGKTVTIRLFLQTTAPLVGTVPDHRMLIYDAKLDMHQILSGMAIDTHPDAGFVKTLNAYDERSWAWSIGEDIGGDDRALNELVLLLVPPPPDDPKEFWSSVARAVVKNIIRAFIARGVKWTLRDLCASMRNLERMRAVLGSDTETEHIIELALSASVEKATKSVEITIYSFIERYESIASMWEVSAKEGRVLSLSDWLHNKEGYILLLGAAARGSALDALNQMIIKRIGQMLMYEQTDSATRRTWIVIDEIRLSGRLDCETLLAVGRSKGVGCVIGFQDKSGLNDAYSQNIADEMLGLCQLKAIFGLATNPTAMWASNEFGMQEVMRKGQIEPRLVVLPSELTSKHHMPMPSDRVGISFFGKNPVYGAYKRYIKKRFVRNSLTPLDMNERDVIRRDPSHAKFVDWTPAEIDRMTVRRLVEVQKEEPIKLIAHQEQQGLKTDLENETIKFSAQKVEVSDKPQKVANVSEKLRKQAEERRRERRESGKER